MKTQEWGLELNLPGANIVLFARLAKKAKDEIMWQMYWKEVWMNGAHRRRLF